MSVFLKKKNNVVKKFILPEGASDAKRRRVRCCGRLCGRAGERAGNKATRRGVRRAFLLEHFAFEIVPFQKRRCRHFA
ncbi:MAG: hypothetical protein KHZ29_09615 [Desulfovibrionaceae bacterium]|nr:hypothetical protein [Desulfovibrionaceae bacterium]